MKLLLVCLVCVVPLFLILAAAERPAGAKQLRHVVAFKFKEGATPQQIAQVVEEFRALKGRIPGISAFEYGVNNSPEGKARGCTHCFTLTFDSEKARDEYLPHPAHKDFGKIVRPLLDEVFVVDYWAHP